MSQVSKATLRKEMIARLQNEPDKDIKSQKIFNKFIELPEFVCSKSVMFYVSTANEVDTRQAIRYAREIGKTTIVPFCQDEQLGLFVLDSLDELTPGSFGILEPRLELRQAPNKIYTPKYLDLIIVPGILFDYQGARLGRGKGYYDRFLPQVCAGACLAAFAFACQLINHVPVEERDAHIDKVITEDTVYECRSFRCHRGR